MSKATMPEPVAEICSGHTLHWAGSGPIAPLCERTDAKVGSLLITTTQAEAYKDACVREALEESARRCVESPMMNTDVYCGATAKLCADRIRSLIAKAEGKS